MSGSCLRNRLANKIWHGISNLLLVTVPSFPTFQGVFQDLSAEPGSNFCAGFHGGAGVDLNQPRSVVLANHEVCSIQLETVLKWESKMANFLLMPLPPAPHTSESMQSCQGLAFKVSKIIH